jgi:hypothetical protein
MARGERKKGAKQFGLAWPACRFGGRAAPSTHQPSTQYPAPGTSSSTSTQHPGFQRKEGATTHASDKRAPPRVALGCMWKLAAARLDERLLGRDAGIHSATLGQGSFLCRTVALQREQATRASRLDRHSDSARVLVQASTCGVRTIESQMGHGPWPGPGSRLRCCDLYPELVHIYQSQGLQLPCHAMPCHVLPGSALLVTPSH